VPSVRPTRLPDRYREDWQAKFLEAISKAPSTGCRILDIGSGRTPAIPPGQRARRCHYVGLDLSLEELDLAGGEAYDQKVVGDACQFRPELEGAFDLIVSWQVLEHVRSMGAVLENCRRYLSPGGLLVVQFSGRYSAFAIANRLVPHRLARAVLRRLLDRDPQTVFPAYYDQCYFDAIVRATRGGWTDIAVMPWYLGASYFSFAWPIHRLYLAIEERMYRGHHLNLATHYMLIATKAATREGAAGSGKA
jgi:SAM-dependent methyltransferase